MNNTYLILIVSLIHLVTSCDNTQLLEEESLDIKFTHYIKKYSKKTKDTIEGINMKFMNNSDSSIYLPTDEKFIYFLFNTASDINCSTAWGGKGIASNYDVEWIEIKPNRHTNLLYGIPLKLLEHSDVITLRGNYKNIRKQRVPLKVSCYINKGKTLKTIIYSDTFCRELQKSLDNQ